MIKLLFGVVTVLILGCGGVVSDDEATEVKTDTSALIPSECPDLACFATLRACRAACTEGICRRRLGCANPAIESSYDPLDVPPSRGIAHRCFCPRGLSAESPEVD